MLKSHDLDLMGLSGVFLFGSFGNFLPCVLLFSHSERAGWLRSISPGEGFALRLAALCSWTTQRQMAGDSCQKFFWAAALQSQCCCLVHSPSPLFQVPVFWGFHSCEYRLVPSYSLSALHWHLPPLFLPIPSITCFSKEQQPMLPPSSLNPALTFPVRILPDSWLQLLLKYFPSTVYVWCKTNLVVKGFNDDAFFFFNFKRQLCIRRFL